MSEADRSKRVAVVGVITREREVLVIRRSQQVVAPGKICFPGGALHEKETDQAGVIRELQEELNLPVRPLNRIWTCQARWDVEIRWWRVEIVGAAQPEPNPTEVEAVWWSSIEALQRDDDLLETNRHFLSAWSEGSFSLFGGTI